MATTYQVSSANWGSEPENDSNSDYSDFSSYSDTDSESCSSRSPSPERKQVRKKAVGTKPCRYGDKCTNKKCTFAHGTKSTDEEATSSQKQSKPKKPCRFGQNCNKDDCTFSHRPTAESTKARTPSSKKENKEKTKPSAPATGSSKHTPRVCRYGGKCKNLDCTFSHDVRLLAKQEPCPFGGNCKNPECAYSHDARLLAKQEKNSVPKKTSETMACPYGEKCYRKDRCGKSH